VESDVEGLYVAHCRYYVTAVCEIHSVTLIVSPSTGKLELT